MKKPCKNHVVDGAVDGAAMAASEPNPRRIQAQPVQKPAPEKLPNVAF